MQKLIQPLVLVLVLLGLGACSTQTIKSTAYTAAIESSEEIPEDELLDLGIAIFDPGLDDLGNKEEELTFADVRMAETFYISTLLSQTLQNTGNWGVVRVIPHDLSSSDLALKGTILQSDGETMRLQINVTDSTGHTWINKEYKEVVSKYSYDTTRRNSGDSFQGLYNRIANDILLYRQKKMSRDELLSIRTVSQIQFARSFAPQVFDDYLQENRRGILRVKRLPADNDPILSRIETIREKDALYVDTLQDYYSRFSRQMETPYTEFRRMSYTEMVKLNRLKADARRSMLLGVAAIIGSVAATQSDHDNPAYNEVADLAVYGGILAGSWLIKDAFNKKGEAQMHVEALAELGQSLDEDVAPQTIDLEERTVTLSGSVDSQYAQWREILADIYANETGETTSSTL